MARSSIYKGTKKKREATRDNVVTKTTKCLRVKGKNTDTWRGMILGLDIIGKSKPQEKKNKQIV